MSEVRETDFESLKEPLEAVSFRKQSDARECVIFHTTNNGMDSVKNGESVRYDKTNDKENVVLGGEVVMVEMVQPLVPIDKSYQFPVRFYTPLDKLVPSARAEVVSQMNAGQIQAIEGNEKPSIISHGLRKRDKRMISQAVPCMTESENLGFEYVAPNYVLRFGVTYFREKGKAPIPLFRGKLSCDVIRRSIDRDGKVCTVEWKIKVESTKEFKCCWIRDNDVSKKIVGLMRSVPGITIEKGAEQYIRNLLSLLAENAEQKIIYVETGWQKIGDKFLFLYDGKKGMHHVDTGKRIYELKEADCVDIFRQALNLFNEEDLAGPMLLYSLYGVMYFLFMEAGYRPTTVLFISGKSGTLKTSIAKVLYRIWNTMEDEQFMSFQSTTASIEPMIKDSWDSIFLIDDYCANAVGEISMKRSMTKNLDTFLRYFGDAVSKQKSNLAGELISAPRPRGGAVVTGEICANGESSLLRTLTVRIPQEGINGKALSVFQKNRALWSSFLSRFITFCEMNFEQLVNQIRQEYEVLRQTSEAKFEARRSIDHWVELFLINQVLFSFLLTEGMDHDEANRVSAVLMHGVEVKIRASEKMAQREDPKKIILEVVIDVIQSHLHIATTQQEFMKQGNFDGYFSKGKIYVLKNTLIERANTVLHLEGLSVEKLGFSWKIIPKIMFEEYGLFLKIKNGSDYCYATYVNVPVSNRKRAFVVDLQHFQQYSCGVEESE